MVDSKVPLFKMVVVGASGVGKTSLINAYQKKKFESKMKASQAAIDTYLKVELQATNSSVDLWTFDLPGQEAHIGLNRIYLRDANVALIVYDVS